MFFQYNKLIEGLVDIQFNLVLPFNNSMVNYRAESLQALLFNEQAGFLFIISGLALFDYFDYNLAQGLVTIAREGAVRVLDHPDSHIDCAIDAPSHMSVHSVVLVSLLGLDDGGRDVDVADVSLDIPHDLVLVVQVASHCAVQLLANVLFEVHV